MRISIPMMVAAIGLVAAVAILVVGDAYRIKAAVPIAFLLCGPMIVGGLVIGLMRGIGTGR